mmetsp:Transcript_15021/g.34397  ORF Transcript_15021/g.34397 Transcript_15021/m.34397 type:complete len:318 (+) Transcript_15021:474-1427(+)
MDRTGGRGGFRSPPGRSGVRRSRATGSGRHRFFFPFFSSTKPLLVRERIPSVRATRVDGRTGFGASWRSCCCVCCCCCAVSLLLLVVVVRWRTTGRFVSSAIPAAVELRNGAVGRAGCFLPRGPVQTKPRPSAVEFVDVPAVAPDDQGLQTVAARGSRTRLLLVSRCACSSSSSSSRQVFDGPIGPLLHPFDLGRATLQDLADPRRSLVALFLVQNDPVFIEDNVPKDARGVHCDLHGAVAVAVVFLGRFLVVLVVVLLLRAPTPPCCCRWRRTAWIAERRDAGGRDRSGRTTVPTTVPPPGGNGIEIGEVGSWIDF